MTWTLTLTLRSIGLTLASAAIVATLALASVTSPRSVGDDDDDEEATFLARQTFLDNCLICHGEDMTSKQRLSAKQWSAEVEKMIGWGSPVPPEQKARLVGYLATTYSENVAPPPPDLVSADDLLRGHADLASHPVSKGDPAAGGLLYARHCATCHGATGAGGDLGPILVERAILARDAAYHEVTRKGRHRMPGFAAVLSGDAEDNLLAWLRRQRVGASAL